VNEPIVRVAQRSFIGARSGNEDSLAVEECGGKWCLVLSDGAGGHSDGALASRLAVERVVSGFRSRPPADPADLAELVLDAHDAVLAAQRVRRETNPTSGMFATVVVLVLDVANGRAMWGHVGDSRLYHWRGGKLVSVTRDDSVLQAMIDTGVVDASRMQSVAHRNLLLAALGSSSEIEPNVQGPLELGASDAFLLCTDGWWGGLETGRIGMFLAQACSPDAWLDAMGALMAEHADPHQDNHSAIACWVGEKSAGKIPENELDTIVGGPGSGGLQRTSRST